MSLLSIESFNSRVVKDKSLHFLFLYITVKIVSKDRNA